MSWSMPTGVVLDTDVASFLFNRDPVRSPRYSELIGEQTVFIPFSSAAEMLFGAEIRGWGKARKQRLQEFLLRQVVVHSNQSVLENWSALRVNGQRTGRMIERQDAWVAAVALTLGLPLVTHNAAHFAGIPLLRVLTIPDQGEQA